MSETAKYGESDFSSETEKLEFQWEFVKMREAKKKRISERKIVNRIQSLNTRKALRKNRQKHNYRIKDMELGLSYK